jgi:hypothetical protein
MLESLSRPQLRSDESYAEIIRLSVHTAHAIGTVLDAIAVPRAIVDFGAIAAGSSHREDEFAPFVLCLLYNVVGAVEATTNLGTTGGKIHSLDEVRHVFVDQPIAVIILTITQLTALTGKLADRFRWALCGPAIEQAHDRSESPSCSLPACHPIQHVTKRSAIRIRCPRDLQAQS